MSSHSRSSGQRIRAIDAFRGFALAGVVLVHMVEQFIGSMPPDDLMAAINQTILDKVIDGVIFILVRGKFFALFSFLFGVSFCIQMDNAARKGIRFEGRFLWRLTLLLMIGYAHSLFYRGDILTIYAMLGMLLVLFYRVPTRVCLALAAVIMLGVPRFLLFALHGIETIIPMGNMSPDLPLNRAYFDALLSGSLWDVFVSNAWHGHMTKLEFQVNYFGRWYLTFAFFLLGLVAARFRLFQRLDELHAVLRKACWISLTGAIALFAISGFLFSLTFSGGNLPDFDSWVAMGALTFMDLSNLCMATFLLTGFLILFRRPGGKRVLGRLAPYGRMALSNYFLQSVIGTFVLYNWGLGMLGELTNTHMLVIAVLILGLQMAASAYWIERYRFGPLEWLWRSGTWFRWQPMSRPSQDVS